MCDVIRIIGYRCYVFFGACAFIGAYCYMSVIEVTIDKFW